MVKKYSQSTNTFHSWNHEYAKKMEVVPECGSPGTLNVVHPTVNVVHPTRECGSPFSPLSTTEGLLAT